MNRLSLSPLLLTLLVAACGGVDDAQDSSSTTSMPALQDASIVASTVAAENSGSLAGRSAEALANTPAIERAHGQNGAVTGDADQPEAGAPAPVPAPAPAPAPALIPNPDPTPTPAPVASALPAAQTCGFANFQQEIQTLMAQARASARSCGTTSYPAASAVGWKTKIFNVAAAHSADMATNNYFSHTGLDGSTPGSRLTAGGYSWSTYGENIAWGQTSPSAVMSTWLNSPGHCANIMNARVTEFAVACVRNPAGRPYWTMLLARPR